MKNSNIFLCAGGTGGHIFPAQALAAELKERGFTPLLISDTRFKDYKISEKEIETIILPVKQVGGNIIKKLWALFLLFVSYVKSHLLVKKYKPVCAVGFGGYPSFPTMLAACHSKNIKTIIHEQNSLLGKANEMFEDKVDAIATSYPQVSGISENNARKTNLTGNPVRLSIKALGEIDYPELNAESVFKILVTGGSQGAKIFSDIVPEAISKLPKEYHNKIFIEQQCVESEIEKVKEIYEMLDIDCEIAAFFQDIPNRLASAHLVIARAGASTLAEITVAGRPIIMVPLPNSAGNHQMVNAKSIEQQEAGWLMEQSNFTAENLALRLENFINMPSLLIETAEKSKKLGNANASKELADLVERVIKVS